MNAFPADECKVTKRLLNASDGRKPPGRFLTDRESKISHNRRDAKDSKTNFYSEQTEEHKSRWKELKGQWNPPHVLRVTEMQRSSH